MEVLFTTPAETQAPVLASADIVRSWKDPRYRRSLSAQQLQAMPQHPAGPAVLGDEEIKIAAGLALQDEASIPLTTALGCTELTFHGWAQCGC